MSTVSTTGYVQKIVVVNDGACGIYVGYLPTDLTKFLVLFLETDPQINRSAKLAMIDVAAMALGSHKPVEVSHDDGSNSPKDISVTS